MANSSFETFKQGGEAIDKAAERTGQQGNNLYDEAKSRASEAYGNAAPDLLQLAKDSAINLQEVVIPKQDQLRQFFVGTQTFANTTKRILSENENNFIALAANSRPILDVFATYSPEFPCLLRGLTDIQPRLEGTFSNGPFLYVHLETMKDSAESLLRVLRSLIPSALEREALQWANSAG